MSLESPSLDGPPSMTRIDPSANLIARIRAQLASGERSANRPKPAGREPRNDPQSLKELTSSVLGRVASIDRADPNRERKAMRLFLEAVLLNELGTGLASDPQFQDMLDHVQAQFDADPELARTASEATRQLLGDGSGV